MHSRIASSFYLHERSDSRNVASMSTPSKRARILEPPFPTSALECLNPLVPGKRARILRSLLPYWVEAWVFELVYERLVSWFMSTNRHDLPQPIESIMMPE